MKNIFKNILVALSLIIAVSSCKKEIDKIVLEGNEDDVVLTTSVAPSTIVLDITKKTLPFVTFTWNNPNYKLNTGTSSQNVTYSLQIDTTGSNFTNPKLQEKVISSDLATTLTTGELNAYLLSMELDFDVAHNIEIRVKAALNNNSAPVYSNVLKYVITPYLDVKYPVPATLFITGNATPSDWTNTPPASQELVKINAYTYEITLPLIANNSYLFLDKFGSWDFKHGFDGNSNANNTLGDNFKPGGGDLKAPAESGTYKITVDFKTGRFTLVKQ